MENKSDNSDKSGQLDNLDTFQQLEDFLDRAENMGEQMDDAAIAEKIGEIAFEKNSPTPYSLTLSRAERAAIDWVGRRYGNGDDLYSVLLGCEWGPATLVQPFSKEWVVIEWIDDGEITFHLSESQAWEIRDIGKNEDGDNEYNWPCFDNALTEKMNSFCESIV